MNFLSSMMNTKNEKNEIFFCIKIKRKEKNRYEMLRCVHESCVFFFDGDRQRQFHLTRENPQNSS